MFATWLARQGRCNAAVGKTMTLKTKKYERCISFQSIRESLFAPVFKNQTSSSSNNNGSATPKSGTLRFSTFGYSDPDKTATMRRQSSCNTSQTPPSQFHHHTHHNPHQHPPPPPHHHLHQYQHHLADATQTLIEMEQFNSSQFPDGIPPPPPPAQHPPPPHTTSASNCSKHQQHLQHLAKTEAAQKGGGGGKNHPSVAPNKMEESRIFVDIRNSAPDVIIMTSH